VFDVSVLQEVAAENDAELKSRLDELEKLWILLSSLRRGYNMTYGGEGDTPTEAVRRKIGNANRGRKWTPELRERIRANEKSKTPS